MKWLSFSLLAVLAVCLQSTLAYSLALRTITVDFVLILLVHYNLHAPRSDGLIAGWLLGLLVDLTTVQQFGVVSIVYGLTSLIIWLIRDLVFTRHPLTHFAMTFLFCLWAHFILRGIFVYSHATAMPLWSAVAASTATAIFTGVCAVPIHRVLIMCSRLLGLGRGSGYGRLRHV